MVVVFIYMFDTLAVDTLNKLTVDILSGLPK